MRIADPSARSSLISMLQTEISGRNRSAQPQKVGTSIKGGHVRFREKGGHVGKGGHVKNVGTSSTCPPFFSKIAICQRNTCREGGGQGHRWQTAGSPGRRAHLFENRKRWARRPTCPPFANVPTCPPFKRWARRPTCPPFFGEKVGTSVGDGKRWARR